MNQIVAVEHITLDGVFQGPARLDEDRRGGFDVGGWGAAAGDDDTVQKKIGAQMSTNWSLLLGRIGFEDIGGFWTEQPPNPFTDSLNRVEKFVAANQPSSFSWQHTTFLNGDVVSAVADLKQRHDKKLVIFGSGMLVRSLMQRDLVDIFVLIVHPLVLGKGRRLFADQGPAEKFRLLDSTATKAGIIVATYELGTT